jgi:hypothetical protein
MTAGSIVLFLGLPLTMEFILYIDIYPGGSKVKTHSVTTLQQQGLTAKAIRVPFKEVFEGLGPFVLCGKCSSFVNKSVYCPVALTIYPF